MKENQWYVKHLSCQFIIRDGIKKYAVQEWTPDHHLRSYGLKSLLNTYSHNLKNSINKNGMLPLKNNIWKWMVSLFLFIRTWTKLLMTPIVRNKVSGTLKNLYIPLKKSKECNSAVITDIQLLISNFKKETLWHFVVASFHLKEGDREYNIIAPQTG